ncbi:MAG: efflux RND transporter periplasmic adaptor subunit [candidate division Zixibacteria bacterium]|nr:efflux RND transporter periplasmic adaptor subunit [candidate division Zixibacteria bacterium]
MINKNRVIIKFLIILSIIVLLFLAGCQSGNENGKQSPQIAGGDKGATAVEAMVIKPQIFQNIIYTTGTLLANEEVELRPEVAGLITGVYFEEGKKVKKGELLLKINDRELQAQLQGKKAEEKQAADEEGRKRRLFEIKVVSQEDYDKVLNALKMVQAEKEAIAAKIAETEIRAPFDGVIGLRYISEGGYVTSGTLVAIMQDTDPMKIQFALPEKYAGQSKPGTNIIIQIGDSQKEYRGVIYAAESKIDIDTRTIKVRAEIPNPDGRLIPGSFAKVEIILEEVTDAIIVPSEAVIPQINGEIVYICVGGKAKATPVQTGVRTDKDIQIIGGLVSNDTLIVSGILQISDGKPVRITVLRAD